MGLMDLFKRKQQPVSDPAPLPVPMEAVNAQPITDMEKSPAKATADFVNMAGGNNTAIYRVLYNGEKNFGELGPALKHVIDHEVLGQRAWQLDLESEITHTVIKQKSRWMLGVGLKLQCEPQVEVLKAYGIDLVAEKFNKIVEPLWQNLAYKTPAMDYAKRVPLQKLAKRADKNRLVRGDILVVLRVGDDDIVTVQLIDGQHVSTPVGLATISPDDTLVDNYLGYDYVWPDTNNRVRNGVEIDATGAHVAYHVRVGIGLQWKRIEAKDSHGSLRAYLVYGAEFRLDNTRGIPEITPSMQGAKQLEDYTVATVGSAVERQRIAYFIEHDRGTEEKDPRLKNLGEVLGTSDNIDMQRWADGTQVANDIAVSTEKMTFNMPAGSRIVAPDSKQEIRYGEFYGVRGNGISATVGIPPEVATQLYGGSYSASRAATNGFQYSLNIDRDDYGNQFYQPAYNLQLDVWVLKGIVQAPGYIEALRKGNQVILSAYRFANWVGAPVPQIDQLKEVQAARLALGLDSANIPMSTFEKEVQDLGKGNHDANVKQYAREVEDALKLGIEPIMPSGATEEEPENEEDKKIKDKNSPS